MTHHHSRQMGTDGRMGSYVYLFVCIEEGKFIVKLGVSDFPTERLMAIRLGSPFKAKTFATIRTPTRKVAFKIEAQLLKALQSFRTRGEWMRFSREEKPIFNRAFATVTEQYRSAAYPMKWEQVSLVEFEKGMELRKSIGKKCGYPSLKDFAPSYKTGCVR